MRRVFPGFFFSFPYNYDCWPQLKVSLIRMHALIRRCPKKNKTWPSTISQIGSLFSPALHSQRVWNKQPLYSSTWSTFRHSAIMCLRLLLANRPGRRFFLIIISFFIEAQSHHLYLFTFPTRLTSARHQKRTLRCESSSLFVLLQI